MYETLSNSADKLISRSLCKVIDMFEIICFLNRASYTKFLMCEIMLVPTSLLQSFVYLFGIWPTLLV
jgi:hypothetical protein